MSSKFSVWGIFSDHFKTLRSDKTERLRWQDFAVSYGLPGVAAAISAWRGYELRSIGEVISGLSILAGFLFALVIFVFQLRLQVAATEDVGSHTSRLLDELFANVNYAVVIGVTTAGLAMLAASSRDYTKGDTLAAVSAPWSAAVIFLAFHLLLIIVMCLKRTRRAYDSLT